MRLGLIGFGNIATAVLDLLGRDTPPAHVAVLTRPGSVADVRRRLESDLAPAAPSHAVVTDAAGLLAERPDLVVECAGHAAATAYVPAILRAGTDVVLVSVGALADPDLEAALTRAATEGGARLVLPAGAIGAVDLLSALRAAGDLAVRYRGIKPPGAWAGTPAAEILDLDSLTEARRFFTGTAREAATEYPKNANVAATLALAGAGFDATEVELTADPAAPGNVHEYSVTSPLANYTIRIENKPSAGNAKTSATTIYSVVREIRNRLGPIAI